MAFENNWRIHVTPDPTGQLQAFTDLGYRPVMIVASHLPEPTMQLGYWDAENRNRATSDIHA